MSFVVIIPFAAKKYIIYYPTMDFPKLAACGTDMAEVVRGILVTVALISGFRKDAIIKIRP